MSIAKERLHKQKGLYLRVIIEGSLLAGVGIFGGFGVLKNGLGESAEGTGGEILNNALTRIMEKSEMAEKLVPICFAGFFFILALVGLIHLCRGIWGYNSAHTRMGQSLLKQAESYESLHDLINSLDTDLERESSKYETIYIGREWVLEDEAMRISKLKGIFTVTDSRGNNALCLVDGNGNTLIAAFDSQGYLGKAAEHLCKKMPDASTGGYDEYNAFLAGAGEHPETAY